MPDFYEILGYVASLIVLVSLLMSSVKRLRWINLMGSLVFAVYGFLIGAIPVGVMNTGIVMINIYYLFQMYLKKDYFTLLVSKDTTYFDHFIHFYKDDIQGFIDVKEDLSDTKFVKLFILRNTVPAGVVVGKELDSKTFEILIDYVTPQYRDFKIGRFLFEEQKSFFLTKGYKTLVSKPGTEKHQKYLKRMGFQAKESIYMKALAPRN